MRVAIHWAHFWFSRIRQFLGLTCCSRQPGCYLVLARVHRTQENHDGAINLMNAVRLKNLEIEREQKKTQAAMALVRAQPLHEPTSPFRRLEIAFSTNRRITSMAKEFGVSRSFCRHTSMSTALCLQLAYGMACALEQPNSAPKSLRFNPRELSSRW